MGYHRDRYLDRYCSHYIYMIKSKLSIFADDTKMMSEVGSHSGVKIIKKDLKQLEAWANTNGMKFNPDKCSVMHCGNNNRNVEYRIYGNEIRETSCEKTLEY